MNLKFTEIAIRILVFSILLTFSDNLYSNIHFYNLKKDTIVSEDSISDSDSSRVILDSSVLGPFFFPIHGKVISHFGRRGHRIHTGTDIKLAHGDTVRAAFTGVVTKASRYYGYGILVVLKHPDNLETYYAHLSKSLVNPGDTIEYGTPLGLGGRTGRATTDHLHFELRKARRALNSEKYFDFNQCEVKNWSFTGMRPVDVATEPEIDPKVAVRDSTEVVTTVHKKYHKIKSGDTLYSLAKKYKTTVDAICKLNHIKPKTTLKLGRKLRMI